MTDLVPTRPRPSLEEETELYRSAMTPRFGWLMEQFFALTFTAIKPDLENLPAVKEAADQGQVVYVMRNRSLLDYLFFNWYFLRYGLPLARFANGINMLLWGPGAEAFRATADKIRDRFRHGPMPDPIDAGFMARTLESGNPVLLFLRRHGSWLFRRPQQSRRDPIEELVRIQRELDQRIYLVPQIVVWERRPEYTQRNLVDLLFGERENPGRLRKLLHFLVYHRGAVVRMGEPVDLQAFLAELPEQDDARAAKKLRLVLRGYLYREKKLIKGPAVKPRTWLLDRIQRSPAVREVVQHTAREQRRPERAVERRAERVLDRIAADFRFNWIVGARILFDFVLNRIYAGVEFREDDAERIRRAGRQGTLVFVPCHRSHLDYILISWIVFYQHMLPPHVAAGANLSFWPLGPVLRRWGAFFLRRSFSDDPLYATLFTQYVKELVREGYTQEFFIEGTRSRTGALLPPRVGMLSMYLDAAAEGVAQDVMFVPMSLSYEKVVEEGEYRRELTGGDKQAEDIRGLAGTTEVLARRYGRVYVRAGEPLSGKQVLEEADAPLGEMDREQRKAFLKRIGERILWEIHRVTPVTPSAVAAAVLLAHDKRGILVRDFHARAEFLMGFLGDRGAVFSNSMLNGPRDALDEALRVFADDKLVQIFEEPDANDIVAIVPEGRLTMDYYKNNIINHLADAALAAVAVGSTRRGDEEAYERFTGMRALLSVEFRSDPQLEDAALAAATLAELIEVDVLAARGGTIEVANPRRAAFLRAMVRNFLEAYLVALRGMVVLRDEPMTERRLIEGMLKEGRKLYMTEDVTRPEAVSKMTLRNAIRGYTARGVLRSNRDHGGELRLVAERHAEELQRLRGWMDER